MKPLRYLIFSVLLSVVTGCDNEERPLPMEFSNESKLPYYCSIIHEDFKKLVNNYPLEIKNEFFELEKEFIENVKIAQKLKSESCKAAETLYEHFLRKFMYSSSEFLEEQLFNSVSKTGTKLSPAMAGFLYNHYVANAREMLRSPTVEVLEAKNIIVWYETKGVLGGYDYNIMVLHNGEFKPYEYDTQLAYSRQCSRPFGTSYEWDPNTRIFSTKDNKVKIP